MTNPIYDKLHQLANMDIQGGHARYQVTFEELNNLRRRVTGSGKDAVPYLKRCLRDSNWQIQIWGVELCDSVPMDYKSDLIEMLHFQLALEEKRPSRNNQQLKNYIKKMLSTLGEHQILDKSLADLNADDVNIRRQAVITLGGDATKNKQALIDVVTTNSEDLVREAAIDQLGKLVDDNSLLDVYATALTDQSAKVRASATRAIMRSRIPDNRIEDLVLQALDDTNVTVIVAVLNAMQWRSLPRTVPKMMKLLTTILPGFVWLVVKGLRFQILNFNNLPEDWQPLLDLIKNADNYPDANRQAVFAIEPLRAMPDLSAMPVFISYMVRDANYEGDPNARPGASVLRTLNVMSESFAWNLFENALTPFLESDNFHERKAVIEILHYIGEENGKGLLRQMRNKESDPQLIALMDQYL